MLNSITLLSPIRNNVVTTLTPESPTLEELCVIENKLKEDVEKKRTKVSIQKLLTESALLQDELNIRNTFNHTIENGRYSPVTVDMLSQSMQESNLSNNGNNNNSIVSSNLRKKKRKQYKNRFKRNAKFIQ